MSSSALKQAVSTSKPTKNTAAASSVLAQNHNPGIDTSGANRTSAPPLTLSQEDTILSGATHLTRTEVLRRRSHNLKQLIRCYKDHYWALMEELKIQYREYYWKYGVSPIVERQPQQLENGAVEREGDDNNVIAEGTGENVNNNINGNSNYNNNNNSKSGGLDLTNNKRCLFVGCKLKAMAMTSFCHLHILSDSKQKLYKPCDYVIKSAQAGPITCGKPILRSTVPSLCSVHFQKAQKHVTRALKKAGLNVTSSSKLAPKFHVIVAEYVHQIQARRRSMMKRSKSKLVVKEETTSEASS